MQLQCHIQHNLQAVFTAMIHAIERSRPIILKAQYWLTIESTQAANGSASVRILNYQSRDAAYLLAGRQASKQTGR